MNNDSQPTFLSDANVFIEAYQRYYSFDICPGFWECLIHFCRQRRLYSIDRVRRELIGRGDALSDWAQNAPADLFVSSMESSVTERYREVMTWVYANRQFSMPAKNQFSGGADGWLVAYAEVHEAILVTHEEHHPDARRRVPLPNVCHQFGVQYQNTFEMLRDLGGSFGWNSPV